MRTKELRDLVISGLALAPVAVSAGFVLATASAHITSSAILFPNSIKVILLLRATLPWRMQNPLLYKQPNDNGNCPDFY